MGGWNVLVGGRQQLGLKFLVPPRPKEEVLFNVFEPKLVDSILYAMIEFFNHGIQGTATWSQLSFVPLSVIEERRVLTQN